MNELYKRFDWRTYKRSNRDLPRHVNQGPYQAWRHYITHGIQEHRRGAFGNAVDAELLVSQVAAICRASKQRNSSRFPGSAPTSSVSTCWVKSTESSKRREKHLARLHAAYSSEVDRMSCSAEAPPSAPTNPPLSLDEDAAAATAAAAAAAGKEGGAGAAPPTAGRLLATAPPAALGVPVPTPVPPAAPPATAFTVAACCGNAEELHDARALSAFISNNIAMIFVVEASLMDDALSMFDQHANVTVVCRAHDVLDRNTGLTHALSRVATNRVIAINDVKSALACLNTANLDMYLVDDRHVTVARSLGAPFVLWMIAPTQPLLMVGGVKEGFEMAVSRLKYNLCISICERLAENKGAELTCPECVRLSEQSLARSTEMDVHCASHPFPFPRTMFMQWGTLSPMSYLHYLTIESFMHHHPWWRVVLYTAPTSDGGEQADSIPASWSCYLGFARDHPAVHVSPVEASGAPCAGGANVTAALQSGLFRYEVMRKYGGLWSDFDILYVSSWEGLLKSCAGASGAVCMGQIVPRPHASAEFMYHPLTCFLLHRNAPLLEHALSSYAALEECPHLATLHAEPVEFNARALYHLDPRIVVMNFECFLPWHQHGTASESIHRLFTRDHLHFPESTIGVHWFGETAAARRYCNALDARMHTFTPMCTLDRLVNQYWKKNRICLFSESTYPGGGGEEFMMDVASFFVKRRFTVYWASFHDWDTKVAGTSVVFRNMGNAITSIQCPRATYDAGNCEFMMKVLQPLRLTHMFSQGAEHKMWCDVGKALNVPTITIWCFWEEALRINWATSGLQEIEQNLDQHGTCDEFPHILANIGHFYFASKFMHHILKKKYCGLLDLDPEDHVLTTLSMESRSINSYIPLDQRRNAKYITMLNAHTLKGAPVVAELILRNPALTFLAIRTEGAGDGGPGLIARAMRASGNEENKLLTNRVNSVRDIYRNTRIVLCPTKLDETFCRVVFESFQNGIPAIFAASGNLRFFDNEASLCVVHEKDNWVRYQEHMHRLLEDVEYYKSVVNAQYACLQTIQAQSSLTRLSDKFHQLTRARAMRVALFTPWCDQGLGIQSRIYRDILLRNGHEVFVLASKPYIATDASNLVGRADEWDVPGVYYSPNVRHAITMSEVDDFIAKYRVSTIIIPEINGSLIFDLARHVRGKHNVQTIAIPNTECIHEDELGRFHEFDQVLANNHSSLELLSRRGVPNLRYLGFHYFLTEYFHDKVNLEPLYVEDSGRGRTVKVLYLSGLNGTFRKRLDLVLATFHRLHLAGHRGFHLTLAIQGNVSDMLNRLPPNSNGVWLTLHNTHLSYAGILNLYASHHLSVQISMEEGLGLGFYESCFMNTPVISLNATPHNEIIFHRKNGWLCSAWMARDKQPINPKTIVNQAHLNPDVFYEELKDIIVGTSTDELNAIIAGTKKFVEERHNGDEFVKRFIHAIHS